MVHSSTVFECAEGVFDQCATLFHDAWFLRHALFVAVNHRFVFPAVELFDAGFFGQTVLGKWALATIGGFALLAGDGFAVCLVFAASGQCVALWAGVGVLPSIIAESVTGKTSLFGDDFGFVGYGNGDLNALFFAGCNYSAFNLSYP